MATPSYQNENEVGEAFQEAFSTGVCKREDVFITTKLWCTFHSRVEKALDESLAKLGLSYVDLYLMHWPVPMNPNGNHPLIPKLADGSRDLDQSWSHTQTWTQLEALVPTGKAKSIGVCNYSVRNLEELLPSVKIRPAVNQIENHPYLPQQEIVDLCAEHRIHVTAYSPFGSSGSPIFKDGVVTDMAKKYNVTPGCILLSWQISRGISVIPKSVTPSRIKENTASTTLSQDDVAAISNIHKQQGYKRYVYPAFGVDLGFPKETVPTAA
ncbi:MAG: hypothetical protein Q9159_003923 [Coniocarpon cinnabarinum]